MANVGPLAQDGGAQKGDGGLGLLVGQHAGEGEVGVIVDGDVQSLRAGERRAAAPPTVAPNGDLRIAGCVPPITSHKR